MNFGAVEVESSVWTVLSHGLFEETVVTHCDIETKA